MRKLCTLQAISVALDDADAVKAVFSTYLDPGTEQLPAAKLSEVLKTLGGAAADANAAAFVGPDADAAASTVSFDEFYQVHGVVSQMVCFLPPEAP